ncbi:hypothetical protein [Tabrizicola thermarum]|uniref:hypothetical protein n=1 Tax=Tabrizicola thermarum TaxID=2670345 RepID=UPI000FFBF7CE|nr:hypothetical protein [Tabrizicola thermarum]
MRRFLLIAVLTVPMSPAFADVTVTGDRGGSAVISRDCARAEGQSTCTRQTLLTGPDGKTASRTRIRTAERGYLAINVTVTGPQGNTRTRDRSLTRGD